MMGQFIRAEAENMFNDKVLRANGHRFSALLLVCSFC